MEEIKNLNLNELSNEELIENEGGIISVALGAATLTIAAIYYTGYAVGKLNCGC